MINRKRYYNSFFDQINDYKQKETHNPHFSSWHVSTLSAGLLGSVLMVGLVGGYIRFDVFSNGFTNPQVAIRTESRPAIAVFQQLSDADNTFASQQVSVPASSDKVAPIADTYVDSANRRSNYALQPVLYSGAGGKFTSYLKFDLSRLTSKEDLILKLYPAASFNGTIQAFLVSNDTIWEEDTLTFESAPSTNGRSLARSSGTFNPGVSVDFDLRDALVTQSTATIALVVTGGSREGFSFYSREHGMSPELQSVQQ